MSILDQIKQDHDQVKSLLKKMLQTTPRGTKSRQELSRKLIGMLAPHTKLLEIESAHEDVLEALEEHQVAGLLLKAIGKTPPEDERWKAKVTVFKEILEHHVEEEEGEIFRMARGAFGPEELISMGEDFLRSKQTEGLRGAA